MNEYDRLEAIHNASEDNPDNLRLALDRHREAIKKVRELAEEGLSVVGDYKHHKLFREILKATEGL